jgi:hypothetical protein
VERGTLLTEMARPVTVFKFRDLNEPYLNLRKFYKNTINPREQPGPLQIHVFRYMREVIDDMVSPEDNDEWNPRASAETLKAASIRHIENVLNKASQESPEKYKVVLQTMIDRFSDYDDFKDYVIDWKKNTGSGRAKYKQSSEEEITSLDPEYLIELGLKLKPYIDKMNKLMFPRIISRSKGGTGNHQSGDYNEDNKVDFDETDDPNNANAQIMVSVLRDVLYRKTLDDYNPEVSEPIGIWGKRDSESGGGSDKSLDYYIKYTPKSEINATIKPLAELIEGKLEQNIGQTLEGVKKLFGKLKDHPKLSNNLKGLLDKIEKNLEENISSDTQTGRNYFGYDPDIYEKVLHDEQLMHEFDLYKTATNRLKENNLKLLVARYENKISELTNKIEGKHELYHKPDTKYTSTKPKNPERNPFTDELETAKMLVNICRKDLMKLKGRFDLQLISQSEYMTENARLIEKLKTEAENLKDVEVKYDQWEADKNKTEEELPVSEGVSSYMVEQYKKDSKFGKQRGEFVERGFKKITNYGQWMMLND